MKIDTAELAEEMGIDWPKFQGFLIKHANQEIDKTLDDVADDGVLFWAVANFGRQNVKHAVGQIIRNWVKTLQ
tara:strand:+ start:4060 stop:4278 length:219 start_codon:yes stop_codon:yes gene_type:complete